jgi:hypothetical protein
LCFAKKALRLLSSSFRSCCSVSEGPHTSFIQLDISARRCDRGNFLRIEKNCGCV